MNEIYRKLLCADDRIYVVYRHHGNTHTSKSYLSVSKIEDGVVYFKGIYRHMTLGQEFAYCCNLEHVVFNDTYQVEFHKLLRLE